VLWSMRHSCAAGEVGTGVADVEDAAVRDGDALGGGGGSRDEMFRLGG